MSLRSLFLLLIVWVGFSASARANPEPIATFDARSAAMAGNGVSFTDTAAAIYQNPAGLSNIPNYSASLSLSSLWVNLKGSLAGPEDSQESGFQYAPLPMAAFAYRVHERVVLGLGAYVLTGFGGGFDDVSCVGAGKCETELPNIESQQVQLWVAEAAFSGAFQVLEHLSVALSVRLAIADMRVDLHQEGPLLGWQRTKQSLFGVGVPSFSVGVQYAPHSKVRFGFLYRAKTTIDLSGDTNTVFGSFDTKSTWVVPHMFRVGADYRPNENWMISAELRYQLHHEANATQRFELDSEVAPTTVADFRWRDVFGAQLGLEWWMFDDLALRAGLSLSNSATNGRYATAFSPPDALLGGLYAGVGYRYADFRFDLGLSWAGALKEETRASGQYCASYERRIDGDDTLHATGGCPGRYDSDAFFISTSLTYQPE